MPLLFLLLVTVPIIEIALFIEVGGWIGLWPTIGVVVLTAIAGTVLLRAQGLATLADLQHKLQAGGNPAPALAHGALILVAGIVLLTPGFFTDAIGLLLLVPPVRAGVIRFLAKRVSVVQASAHMRRGGRAQPGAEGGPQTVDGEYSEVEPEPAGEAREGSGWTRVPDRSDSH